MGSSPHVRGFVAAQAGFRASDRFIPACAGFCTAVSSVVVDQRVHPRMCGVLFARIRLKHALGGSSPHVRGFEIQHGIVGVAGRFIPACAGF